MASSKVINLRDLTKARVIVVGDVLRDLWYDVETERISPEAPVPVFRVVQMTETLGGAGNVAENLKALGCTVELFGAGRSHVPTKNRFRVGHHTVFRFDQEKIEPINSLMEDTIYQQATFGASGAGCLILSDYGKGLLTPRLCQRLIQWAKLAGMPVVVDPKSIDWSKYSGATVITPNEAEYCDRFAAHEMAKHEIGNVLVTRGDKGMALFMPNLQRIDIPAQAREVFDVTGAGDTVAAALGAGLAVGWPLEQAARVANAAAGVVVGKRGAATCSLEELERAMPLMFQDGGTDHLDIRNTPPVRQHNLGFTNGCFDLLHEGHIHLLKEAQKRCAKLIVAVNGDESVKRLKGPCRPVQSLRARRTNVMAHMRPDDEVVSFDTEQALASLIWNVKPDVIFKGGEYVREHVVGSGTVHVVLIPMLEGFSTSAEIERGRT